MNRLFGALIFSFVATTFILPSYGSATPSTEAEVEASGTVITTESLNALAEGVGIPSKSLATPGPRRLKIAILDSGFQGFSEARGRTVPASTKLHSGPTPFDPKNEDGHGLKMAEILTNLLDRTGTRFELHLFRTNGFDNFQSAVKTAIVEKFDVILYATVLEYGGNGDGGGFINKVVSSATASGIAWINATGNFGRKTYRAPIERTADDWASLPGPNGSVQLRCFPSKLGVCRTRIVLSWNSFSDDVEVGTDKDLDLVVTDDTGKILERSGLIQKKSGPIANGESLYPREIVQIELRPGVYYLKAKLRSANFTKADELRFSVAGDFVELLNRTEGETLNNPADNPSVISAGATDTLNSSVSRKLSRPDVSAPSLIKTEDGAQFKGSSQAAAAYAARIAYELSRLVKFDRESMIVLLRGGTPRPKVSVPQEEPAPNSASGSASGGSRSRSDLGSTGPGCYNFHALILTGEHVRKILHEGGVVVDSASGPKIFIDEDPFTRASRLGIRVDTTNAETEAGSILIADRQGLYATSVRNRNRLPAETAEIVRTPQGASYCPIR